MAGHNEGVGVILDNGCKRNVGGSQWHRAMQAMQRGYGLKGIKVDVQEEFLFGSDCVDVSLRAWIYPVGVHGGLGTINIAEIESNCPGLMCEDTMSDLDVHLHTRDKTYDIGSMGVKDYKFERSHTGHALLRVDWFGDLSNVPSKFCIENDNTFGIRSGVAKRLRKAASFLTSMHDDTSSGQNVIGEDYWELSDGQFVRHHVVPRQTLFCPTDVLPSGMDVTSFSSGRTTELVFTQGNAKRNISDLWQDEKSAHKDMKKSWTGKTIFTKNDTTTEDWTGHTCVTGVPWNQN